MTEYLVVLGGLFLVAAVMASTLTAWAFLWLLVVEIFQVVKDRRRAR